MRWLCRDSGRVGGFGEVVGLEIFSKQCSVVSDGQGVRKIKDDLEVLSLCTDRVRLRMQENQGLRSEL